ncbi:hypothetical protein [Desulfosporosinus acidiphilus]|nr:hypothetical protein [Desulfosporosinus acidiphilus]
MAYKQLGDYSDCNLSRQWESWWTQLIHERSSNLSNGVLNPINSLFNPPEFSDLGDRQLTNCCKEAWPLFSSWWEMPAGGGSAMAYWESVPNVINIVHKFEQKEGKNVKDFRLHIDLVYTGISERIELRQDYVIMALDIKQLREESWWMQKLRQIG